LKCSSVQEEVKYAQYIFRLPSVLKADKLVECP